MNPFISIVIPVYGGELTIVELVNQLKAELKKITEHYEIILIDDCGPDKSWEKIKLLCDSDPKVIGIRLSKNFGQHFAITAGIDMARGNFLVVMDCDLQDDPKYIPLLYEKIKEGNDIVFTFKKKRKHSVFKNVSAYVYNVVFNYLIDNKNFKASSSVGAYSMINEKVIKAFRKYNDYQRHYLMVLRWLGFKSVYIEIEHKERFAGKSSYNFTKLIKHGIDGITSQSDKLLRIFVTIGLSISIISFCSILIIIFLYFFKGLLYGWASTIIVLLFSTGMILTGIGILGIYLGKTFEQTKGRPKYLIDEKIN